MVWAAGQDGRWELCSGVPYAELPDDDRRGAQSGHRGRGRVTSRKIDTSLKPEGNFSLPSVHHYLIVDPEGPPVIHHGRQAEGPILTSIVDEGVLSLTPPGVQLDLAEMYPPA